MFLYSSKIILSILLTVLDEASFTLHRIYSITFPFIMTDICQEMNGWVN